MTYPNELTHGARLASGAPVHVRAIRPDDESRLVALFDRLGMRSRDQRFFSSINRLPAEWAHDLANVDYQDRLALVAEREREGRLELLGVARYEPSDADDVREVALVVDDRWQGQGLGTLLFEELLRAADARGIRRFRALVLADNRGMPSIIERAGAVVERRADRGVVDVVFTRAAEDERHPSSRWASMGAHANGQGKRHVRVRQGLANAR